LPPLQLIGAFLDSAFGLMRFIPLIIFWVKSRFLAGTERAKVRAGWRMWPAAQRGSTPICWRYLTRHG
jgi:hypothetical protein